MTHPIIDAEELQRQQRIKREILGNRYRPQEYRITEDQIIDIRVLVADSMLGKPVAEKLNTLITAVRNKPIPKLKFNRHQGFRDCPPDVGCAECPKMKTCFPWIKRGGD